MIIRDESIQLLCGFEMMSFISIFENQKLNSPFFAITLSPFPQTMKEMALIGGLSSEIAARRKKFFMISIFCELLSVFNKNLDLWLVWPKSFHPICFKKMLLKKITKNLNLIKMKLFYSIL